MENQQPPVNTLAEPVKVKRTSKLPIILMTIITLLSLATSGYLAYQNYLLNQKISQLQEPTPSPTTNPTENWKIYINTQYGFSFKYPEIGYVVEERVPGYIVIASSEDIGIPEKGISIDTRLSNRKSNYGDAESQIQENLNISESTKLGNWQIFQGTGTSEMTKHIEFRDAIAPYKTGAISVVTTTSSPYLEIFDLILTTFEFVENTNDETANWKTYTDEDNIFSIKYPDNWYYFGMPHGDAFSDGKFVIFSSTLGNTSPQTRTSDENARLYITFTSNTKSEDVKNWLKDSELMTYEVKEINISEYNALQITTPPLEDDTGLSTYTHTFVITPKWKYTISGAITNNSKYNNMLKIILNMLDSIEINE